jgi:hypothetical protein
MWGIFPMILFSEESSKPLSITKGLNTISLEEIEGVVLAEIYAVQEQINKILDEREDNILWEMNKMNDDLEEIINEFD